MTATPSSDYRELVRKLSRLSLVRFGVVGVSNAVVTFAVFWSAHRAVGAAFAQALAYVAGTFWSYYWNRRWTFQSKGNLAGEAARFIGLQAAFMFLSAGAMGLLVDRWHLPAGPSWLAVATLVTAMNFVASRYWAFRKS